MGNSVGSEVEFVGALREQMEGMDSPLGNIPRGASLILFTNQGVDVEPPESAANVRKAYITQDYDLLDDALSTMTGDGKKGYLSLLLECVATEGDVEALKIVLSHGAEEVSYTQYHPAACPVGNSYYLLSLNNNVEGLEVVHNHFSEVSPDTVQDRLNEQTTMGNTPVHAACKVGALEALEFLLDRGADTTIQNKRGDTPLHVAVQEGHEHIYNRLMELEDERSGIDIENDKNQTPVDILAGLS